MHETNSPASRRTVLKTAAALAATALLPRGAAAQLQPVASRAAAKPVQGGGFYHMMLGDAEVTLVADGGFVADDANAFFKGDSGDAVNNALAERHLKPTKLQMFIHTLLVKKGGKTTLIDAGTGGRFGPTAGFLFDRLAAIGTPAEAIDAVVLTHAHGDHYGGLLDANGKSRFANAELIVSEAEYDFWTKSPDLSKSGMPAEGHAAAIKQQQDLFAALQFTRVAVAGDKQLRPGITAVPTPGHTPGHLSILVDGGGNDQLFYNADLIHHVAIMLPHPEYKVAFDTDQQAAAETRKKVFARLAADKVLVSGTHVPFPGFGYVEKAGEGYEWRPAMWQW
jgi:glyoxylase-like metal-dependent hydrolase (beta-lactamase superfamily II)